MKTARGLGTTFIAANSPCVSPSIAVGAPWVVDGIAKFMRCVAFCYLPAGSIAASKDPPKISSAYSQRSEARPVFELRMSISVSPGLLLKLPKPEARHSRPIVPIGAELVN